MDGVFFYGLRSVKRKQNQAGIWAIYKLLTKYFIRSGIGPFIVFFLPLVLHVIIGLLVKSGNTFGGIATNVGLLVGMLVMPNAVMQFKTSSVIKMLGASPVKPATFFIAISTYFTFLLIIAVVWLSCWSMVIFQGPSKMTGLGTPAGFFAFALGTVVNGFLCMGLGCLIINFSKSTLSAQVYGLLAYFPFSFLTGQFIPPSVYLSSNVIFWIGRMTPWHYVNLWNIQAVNGEVYVPVFNLSTNLFEITDAGTAKWRLLSDANSFAYADYRIPNDTLIGLAAGAAKYNETYNAVLQSDGQQSAMTAAYNAFGGPPYDSRVFFSRAEHAVAYVYPVLLTALTMPAVLRTFKWR